MSDDNVKADATATDTPEAVTRSRINLFIVALLSLQLLLPLRYYLGLAGGDDERFSWRMFSTVRLQRCELSMSEVRDGSNVAEPLALKPILQVAWISIMQRLRPSVVEGFLRFRCETEGIAAVNYERRCVLPDGAALPPNRLEIDCASGAIRTLDESGSTP